MDDIVIIYVPGLVWPRVPHTDTGDVGRGETVDLDIRHCWDCPGYDSFYFSDQCLLVNSLLFR